MDQFIFESEDFLSDEIKTKTGRYALMSMKSPAKKTVNEDACCFFSVSTKLAIAVVCDGVGGNPNGNVASKTIIEVIKKACLSKKKQKIRNAILDAIEKAGEDIMNHEDGSLSTCILAEIHPGWVRFYHAGDSMAVLLNKKNELLYYTVSHAPLAYGLELGIKRKELQHIKNLVNNVVGSADLRIEVSAKIPLEKKDKLILMSDGLSDNYELSDLCEKFAGEANFNKMLETIKTRTLEKMLNVDETGYGGPDDLTAIVYQSK